MLRKEGNELLSKNHTKPSTEAEIVKYVNEHCHESTKAEVESINFHRELKEASLKNPQQTTRSTISTAISNSDKATIAQLPTLSNIARSVRGWKTINENFPTSPQSRMGFSIPPRFKTLENSEENFLYMTLERRIR
ncbi:Putative LOC100898192, partial [Caligus rogercresseyi]